jgi:hypothetical protein
MSAMSDYLENQMADFYLRGQAMTVGSVSATWSAAAPALYIALCTAAPTDASTGATITEVANSNGYARTKACAGSSQALTDWKGTHSSTTGASSGTGGVVSNAAAITFPSPTGGGWGVITHFAVVDSATWGAGNVLFWGALSASKTVNGGDAAPSFAIDALTITFG